MSIKASRRFYGIVLAAVAVGAFAACSSDDPPPSNNPTAGTAGTGTTGGSGGSGGSSTAGTSSTAGSSAAGSSTAGSSTGGSGGSGGGSGDAQACAGGKPASNLISSFDDLVASTTTPGQFTFMEGIPGGTFTYSTDAIKAAATDMALHITGTVSNYNGFGVYLNSCTNASDYTGVSFNIKGNVGPSAKLNFRVQINTNTKIDVTNKKGTCVVPTGTEDYQACRPPSVDITDITPAGKTVTIPFSTLTDGVPSMTVKPEEIVGFEWAFTWPNTATGGSGSGGSGGAAGGSGGTGGDAGGSGGAAGGSGGAAGGSGPAGSYPVDLTIDDFTLIGGPSGGGSGGSGGSAGSGGGSGGSGGAEGGSSGSGGSGGTTP